MNMKEVTKAQMNEAQAWIRDCSWLEEAEDLEDLTDEEVRRGIDRHYEGGWIQFIANCQFTSPRTVHRYYPLF
jgi:hypothetical protein